VIVDAEIGKGGGVVGEMGEVRGPTEDRGLVV
jgi:hypothetical protein